jgi:membrane protein
MADVAKLTNRATLELEKARARYGPVDIGITTFKRFSEDDGGVLAAALTYYTFFSIFPMLLFVASAIGYLTFLSDGFRENLLRSGVEGIPLLNQIVTFDTLESLKENRGTLAIFGLLLALYSGTGAVVALKHALNRIARVKDEGNFLAKRLASLRWLGILAVAAVISLGTTTLVRTAGFLVGGGAIVDVLAWIVLFVASIAVNTAIFIVTFRFLSDGPPRTLQAVLPGAILAAAAFEGLKLVGSVYLGAGADGRNATFGAFSTAAGLLVASYLLAQITLLAAELNAVMFERSARRSTQVSKTLDET